MNPPLTEQQILDQVTGSNAKLGSVLAGKDSLPPLPALPSISDTMRSILTGGAAVGGAIIGGPAVAASVGAIASTPNPVTNIFGLDIARIATVIVGAMLIAAGLFGLAGGKAIHIYQTLKP